MPADTATLDAAREMTPRAAQALERRLGHARDSAGEIAHWAEHFEDRPTYAGGWEEIQGEAESLYADLAPLLERACELRARAEKARDDQRDADGVA